MNALVTAFSFALVGGLALYGMHVVLGQYAILGWIGVGLVVLHALCARANAN